MKGTPIKQDSGSQSDPGSEGSGLLGPAGTWKRHSTASRQGFLWLWALAGVALSDCAFFVVEGRFLGPASFGALGALLSVTAFLTVPLAALQVVVASSIAQRAEGVDVSPLGRLLPLAVATSGLGIVVWTGATPIIDRFFHLTSPRQTVVLGLWLLPAVVNAVLQGSLLGQRRFRAAGGSLVMGVGFCRLGFGVLFAELGLGVTGATAATLIGASVSAVAAAALLWPQLRWRGAFVPKGTEAGRPVLALGGVALLAVLGPLLARHFESSSAAGMYTLDALMGRVVLATTGVLAGVYFPQLKAAAGTGHPARRALSRCLVLMALLGLVGAALVTLLRSVIVQDGFGSAYSSSISAVSVVASAQVLVAISGCLLYYQLTRRSRLALSSWPACVLFIVLASLFHGSPRVLGVDLLVTSGALVAAVGLPTAAAVLRSLAEDTSSISRSAAMLGEPELDLTVVVPFHNVGSERLRAHLQGICDVLAATGTTFEVVPVSDGSSDGSEAAVHRLSSALVRPIVFAENRGKGEALRIGLVEGRGRYLGFIDGDGDIPPNLLTSFVDLSKSQQPDMVVGSKRHRDSQVVYPPLRRLGSVLYQLLTRALFGLKVRDTQTGIKLVRRDVLAEVLPRMVEKRFAFDLELLAVAHRLGYRQTAELPVEIGERFASTISPLAAWRMLQDTLATFYRLRILRFYDPPLAVPGDSPDGLDRIRRGERLRILLCNWRDLAHPHAGGAEVYSHAMAREWVERGHQVTWFTSSVSGRPSLEIVDGIHIIRRGGRHTVYREARRFFERQGRGRYDLVIDEVNTRPFGAARWASGTPTVAVVHQVAREVWFHEMPWPFALIGRFWLEPRWLRGLSDVPVLTLSESSRQSLVAYGISNVWVVPPGQSPLEAPIVRRECQPTMVFVGRLTANKRPEDVLAAFRSVRQRVTDAQLWVVGTGPLEAELRRRAPEGVTFLGRLSDADKVDRLARAHALVATSVREGWGLNVSEAAQVGTPAVAYDVAGLRDSVSASGGILVEPRPEALAKVLADHLPRWAEGDLPPVRKDAVVPWARVADKFFSVTRQGLEAAAEERARVGRADIRVAWRRALGPISWVCDRRAWSLAGIAALVFVAPAAKVSPTVWEGRFAGIAFACFAVATIGALADAARLRPIKEAAAPSTGRRSSTAPGPLSPAAPKAPADLTTGRGGNVPRWLWPVAIVGVVTAATVQVWFAHGGALAHADVSPPAGTAWLSSLFTSWGGSNLGGPTAGATNLPWAAVYSVVHFLGGSGALAQRIWLTMLFCGVGVSAVSLVTALGMGTVAAVCGGLVYAFSSYVVAFVGPDAVTLAALVLVPALLAWVISASRAPRIRWWLVGLLPAAALLGVVAQTPPMVLACAAALIVGPLLVGWLYGRRLLFAAIRRTALGAGVLLGASAYWAVPYGIQVFTTGAAQGAAARSWQFTEIRATLANGFWLNDVWSWAYPQYVPYAHLFNEFPLLFVRYLLPIMAFSALGIGALRVVHRDPSRLRLIGAASAVALIVVFLSTGTLFPGSTVFNVLYALPFGWLLQEPNRFLFLAGLAYAVLIAIGVDAGTANLGERAVQRDVVPTSPRWRAPALSTLGVAVLLIPAWPLITTHSGVTVPDYWNEMASVVNHPQPGGSLLVLPEDDYYQMPYTWYYGNDDFIGDMMERPVIDPVGQGYTPNSPGLLGAVALLQTSVLNDDWKEVAAIADAIDCQEILVRGDIESNYPARTIADPAQLASALSADPDLRLVERIGPLDLFAFRNPLKPLTLPMTVSSSTPDLEVLADLPAGTALVTSPPVPGVAALSESTSPDDWRARGAVRTDSISVPSRSLEEVAAASGPDAGHFVPVSGVTQIGNVSVRLAGGDGDPTLVLTAPPDEAPSVQVVVVSKPEQATASSFFTNRVTYGSRWDGPSGARLVEVDGLMDGWLSGKPPVAGDAHYVFGGAITAVDIGVGIAVVLLVGGVVIDVPRFIRRRNRSRPRLPV